ncbi:MAG: phage baseplate assembly protein V [Rhodospirillaceae bacterium]
MNLSALIEDLRQQVADLDRRLSNVVRPGQIFAVDPARLVCRHKSGDLVTGWVRWLTHRAGEDADWWVPSVGEQAILFSPDGEPNQGWVLPAGYSAAFPAPESDPARHVTAYRDGARIVYDTAAHKLTADLPGDADLTVKGDLAVAAEGSVSVTAKGEIAATSETRISVSAPAIQMIATQGGAGAATLTGDFALEGNLEVQGNIHATGTIIDDGGNTPNHTHP